MKLILMLLLIFLFLMFCIAVYFYNISISRSHLEKEIEKREREKKLIKDQDDKAFEEKEKENSKWLENNAYIISMKSSDKENLKLYARTKVLPDSKKWAVLVHGYSGNSLDLASVAEAFLKKGYSVLLPDLRGHGLSDGTYTSMGIKDARDIVDWCNLINENNKECRIILYGISMGAATVLNASGLETLPSNVKAVVEDCSYTSAYEQFSKVLKDFEKFPIEPTMSIENLYVSLVHGFNFKELQPIEMVQKSKLPTMFIHGEKDTYVPFKMLDELYYSCKNEKVKLVVPNARHAESRKLYKDKYFKEVFNFLDKFVY